MSIKIPDRTPIVRNMGGVSSLQGISWCASSSWRLLQTCIYTLMFILVFGVFTAFAERRVDARIVKSVDQLPVGVQRMYQAILKAARSGEIDQMREVLQMNELLPLINGRLIRDPVTFWKMNSKNKSAHETLSLLIELLTLPPVKKKNGRSVSYIWPYFAGVSLQKLSASEIMWLYWLVGAKKAALMLKNNQYSHGVVIIGADGTWHSFDH